MVFKNTRALVAFVVLSGACTHPAHQNESDLPSDTSDSSSPFIDDCVVSDDVFSSVQERLGSIATVVVLDWTATEEGESFVRFVNANGALQTIPSGTVANAHALLLGLEQNTKYAYQLVLRSSADTAWCSTTRTVTTGSLPADLPKINAKLTGSPGSYGGFVITTVVTDRMAFPAIIDANGQYVWALRRSLGYGNGISITRTTVTADRSAVVFVEGNPNEPYIGKFFSYSMDGEPVSSFAWAAGTDFQILPDGTFAILTRSERNFVSPEGEDQLWKGDSISEYDPRSGITVPIWDVFNDFSPEDPSYARPIDEMSDWAHVNSLSYDVAEDAYFVTAENPTAIIRIRRSDGQIEWLIDAEADSTIPNSIGFAKNADVSEILNRPHSAQYLGNAFVVFNRSNMGDLDSCARTSEISIDEKRTEARLAWTWQTDTCMFNDFLGEAERLPNGNTQVIWSAAGRIDEVTPDGADVFRIELESGRHLALLGFGERTDSLYPGGAWSGRAGFRPQ